MLPGIGCSYSLGIARSHRRGGIEAVPGRARGTLGRGYGML